MSAPSVLEYARSHGLAFDHTTENPFDRFSHLPLISSEDDVDLPDPDFSPFVDELSEPKLQLNRRAGTLLAESTRRPHHVISWDDLLPTPHRIRKLKIEEPLLAGDHETDVCRFRRHASSRWEAKHLLEEHNLIRSEEDFDDEWNNIQSGKAVEQLERELENERCHTTKEALVCLSDVLKNPLTDESKAQILDSFLPPMQKSRARSLTPNLMPEEQSPEPYIPSSPDLDFPFRSDQDVDFDNLLVQIDNEMKEADQICSDEVGGVSLNKVKHILQEARTMPELKVDDDLANPIFATYPGHRQARKELENLKFDVPILSSSSSFIEELSDAMMRHWTTTPTTSSPTKPKQPFALNSLAQNIIPNSEHQTDGESVEPVSGGIRSASVDVFPLPHFMEPEDDEFGDASDVDISEEIMRLTDTAGREVDVMLDKETVGVPEDCVKHSVPKLDKVSVRPPWRTQREDLLARIFDAISLISTSDADLQKEKNLNWQAIPNTLMRLGVIDRIEEDTMFHKWLQRPSGVTTSEQLISKKPGLRLLNMEDESDIELVEDIDLLVDMQEPITSAVPAKRCEDFLDTSFKVPAKKLCVPRADDTQVMGLSEDNSAAARGSFSTSDALETFLDLRGGKFKKTPLPQPQSANELADDPIQPTQSEAGDELSLCAVPGRHPLHARTNSTATTVLVPSTQDQHACDLGKEDVLQSMELEWSRTVIVETSILQWHRQLINFLESRGNGRLNIVYREMQKIGHDTYASATPDVILNPRTALIFTNMQALNQKSLPGQGTAGHSLVQSRVLKLASEFDRLYVLVSTPKLSGTMLQARVDTITAFTGFCANLSSDSTITVKPVWAISEPDPQAINEALNLWTWSLVSQHAFPEIEPAQSVQQVLETVALINDETLWERLLRRMGLNPMAAQIVLGCLKELDLHRGNFDQNSGLRRLVQIHPEERREMFADTLGSRVIQRLNDVIDRNWG
ncbi:hypothetical protein H2200_012932 [Cladophialophora chaetospira]|uniref:Uncharacterized protein n=1 Tax=Cladophialophora chaetospira TaxID=386627 RepID=A0AA38WX36_9EURO|nr:hypothetical protein H2200_012932 [Cladophialophora chaetospira]